MIPGARVKDRVAAFRAAVPTRRFESKKQDKVGKLFIYDVIGVDWFGGIAAKDVAKALETMSDVDSLEIYVNSPGGDVFEGVAIYNIIRRFDKPKTVFVDGLAASAASLIALAGDKRVTAKNAMWMIHNPWTIALGNANDFRKVADELDKISGTMVETYIERTGQKKVDIVKWLEEETWMTAQEARDRGFTNEILGMIECMQCGAPCLDHTTTGCDGCIPDSKGECSACGAACSDHTTDDCDGCEPEGEADDKTEKPAGKKKPAARTVSPRAVLDPLIASYKNAPPALRERATAARSLIESMEASNKTLTRARPAK